MLACGEQIRPVCMMASSMKQESRGFSHERFKGMELDEHYFTVAKDKMQNNIVIKEKEGEH